MTITSRKKVASVAAQNLHTFNLEYLINVLAEKPRPSRGDAFVPSTDYATTPRDPNNGSGLLPDAAKT